MSKPHTTLLKSHGLQLEPIKESHKSMLYSAAQNQQIWQHTSAKAFGDEFEHWFDKALQHKQQGDQLPFAIRRLSDNSLLGSTRYYDICPEHCRLSIGYTWMIPEVWGSWVNPLGKLLLLEHAFKHLNINRVQFKTDIRNMHSRAAIKKLGAVEEGILRYHMVLDDGSLRDSVIYSIIKPDWPHIKTNLQARVIKSQDRETKKTTLYKHSHESRSD